jgi:hypothetical protein
MVKWAELKIKTFQGWDTSLTHVSCRVYLYIKALAMAGTQIMVEETLNLGGRKESQDASRGVWEWKWKNVKMDMKYENTNMRRT